MLACNLSGSFFNLRALTFEIFRRTRQGVRTADGWSAIDCFLAFHSSGGGERPGAAAEWELWSRLSPDQVIRCKAFTGVQ